jgi:phage terminase small subunit
MKTVIPRKMGRPPALTMRQKKFAELYVFDRGKKTQTQCAFEAGYKNRASATGSDLTNNRKYPLVCAYINKLEKEQERRFRISKSIHMQDLGKIKNVSMEQPSTYSVAQRAEENRGKVMGYYKNENINTNVNIEIDGMSKEDLVKEFDSFYKEKMKDVTPTKASIKSKEELNPDTDSE